LLDGISELYVSKGKKVVHINLKRGRPDDETLRKLITGRSGNLRAPVIKRGKILIVGFNEETYESVIGG
jgi:arsenate reductase-like glutaredoxin family protein